MSQYATEAEFLSQSIPSDAWTGLPAGTIDTSLAWASGRIDSYLRKRYSLPLTSAGDELKEACCAIAAWNLLRRRGFRAGSGADEAVVKAHDDAVSWLRDVSRGLAELDASTDATPPLDEAGTLTASETAPDWRWFTGPRC